MRKEDVQELKHGVYRVWWEDGGSSVGCVGSTYDGTRWLACANWTTPNYLLGVAAIDHWNDVKSVDLIATV